MHFFKDGFSIDETKVSILLVLLVVSVAFALTMYFKQNFIGGNLAGIITALIYSVAGVNTAHALGGAISQIKG